MNIRHRYCVIVFLCTFSVFIGQICCAHNCMYRQFVHVYMYARYEYEPYVEFTVTEFEFYEILIMLRIKFTRLWYESEFNTWQLPKKVGLLTFCTIRFLHFRYVQRIVNYTVLTQAVPRINLFKISHSQVNIYIIFITFLSRKFQCWCRHKVENVDITKGGRG